LQIHRQQPRTHVDVPVARHADPHLFTCGH
jgi:hypothetical protein